ncbi:MAG: Na+/H+ antiporter subunit D [Pseudomonadota bacterium]
MSETAMADMTPWLVAAPAAILIVATGVAVAFWGHARSQIAVAFVSLALQTLASLFLLLEVMANGPLAMSMGGWPAPFGIALVADPLSAGLSLLTGIIGLAVVTYSVGDVLRKHRKAGFYPLVIALLLGVNGAFLTGDVFNLYVWFEIILIASFGLLVLGGTREQIDGAVKYAFLNLIATTILLIAIGLLYGIAGTLSFADLAVKLGTEPMDTTFLTVALLFLLAFGMKAAVFPVYFWLPAAYHTPLATVSAVFAGLLTKVGVYSLYRVFSVLFAGDDGTLAEVLLIVAIFTMVLGALGALAETDVRRFVSFLVVSGVGVMLAGLAIGGRDALMAGVFYTLHSIIASAGLFMAAGLMVRLGGTTDLRTLSGLYRSTPFVAVLFFLVGLSMAGVPPFAGFWAKVHLVSAALDGGYMWTASAVLFSGFITLVAIGRLWALAFLRERESGANALLNDREQRLMGGPLAILAAMTFAIGIFAGPLTNFSFAAADGLVDPAAYIEEVLEPLRAIEAAPDTPYGESDSPLMDELSDTIDAETNVTTDEAVGGTE